MAASLCHLFRPPACPGLGPVRHTTSEGAKPHLWLIPVGTGAAHTAGPWINLCCHTTTTTHADMHADHSHSTFACHSKHTAPQQASDQAGKLGAAAGLLPRRWDRRHPLSLSRPRCDSTAPFGNTSAACLTSSQADSQPSRAPTPPKSTIHRADSLLPAGCICSTRGVDATTRHTLLLPAGPGSCARAFATPSRRPALARLSPAFRSSPMHAMIRPSPALRVPQACKVPCPQSCNP